MNSLQLSLQALGLAALLHAGLSVADEPVAGERIQTRNGVLQVAGLSGHRDYLMVDGKRVFAGPDDFMELWHDYRVGAADAVLFSTDCSGSGCGQRHFYYLLLRRGSRPAVITSPDFFTADGNFNFSLSQSEVTVELGFEKGLRKWAKLDGHNVLVHHDASDARISEDDCARIHRMALDDCSNKYEGKCGFDLPVGSHSDMGALTNLSNAPGFDKSALGAACHKQCTTGMRPSFEEFSRQVCGFRSPR